METHYLDVICGAVTNIRVKRLKTDKRFGSSGSLKWLTADGGTDDDRQMPEDA